MRRSKVLTILTVVLATACFAGQALAATAYKPVIVPFAGQAYGSMTGSVTPYITIPGFIVASYGGSGNASSIGNFSFDADQAVRWDSAVPNGAAGYCAPSSGETTLTANDGSKLYLNFTGLFCEAGYQVNLLGTQTTSHVPAPPYTFNGTFLVMGGSGKFAAKYGGSGSLIISSDIRNNVFLQLDGKLLK
jgi:hypothetical protein